MRLGWHQLTKLPVRFIGEDENRPTTIALQSDTCRRIFPVSQAGYYTYEYNYKVVTHLKNGTSTINDGTQSNSKSYIEEEISANRYDIRNPNVEIDIVVVPFPVTLITLEKVITAAKR